jgi:hypothetical protein
MNKKEFIEIAGIKVEKNKKYILPKDADEFTRASWLIMGRIKPETESDFKILKEAEEMKKKGIVIELPFN